MKRLFYFAAAAIALAACNKAEDGNGNTNGSNNGNDNEVNKDFIENEGSFTYFGDTYKTVKLEDGTVWMAEPLRYIPEGLKPSSDPEDDAAHIWYPYIIKDGTAIAATSEEDTKKYEADPKVHKTLRSPLFFYKYNNQIWMTTEN